MVSETGEETVEFMCDSAFLSGGSPTYGLLTFATDGSTTGGLFSWMASSGPDVQGSTDWGFTLGTLLIGLNASIYLGIGNWWQGQEIVKKYPMLR